MNDSFVLRGTPASSGTATGKVRIARTISDLDELDDGEILVVEHSNPSWTVGMLKAAAIIASSGGIICHAALVAREMGIPAVVALDSALEALHTGQVITVNGDDGTVCDG